MAQSPAANATDAPTAHPLARFHFVDLGFDSRFNYMDRENGPVTDRGAQYRIRTRLSFEPFHSASTQLLLRSETGKGFDNSWNNTGLGLGSQQTVFDVKSLGLRQQVSKAGLFEAGGLDFDKGVGTDAIHASDDGFFTGYRATVADASAEPSAKISLTAGYVGDFTKPNFFSRARMDRVNYLDLLAERKFGGTILGSVEAFSLHNVAYTGAALDCHSVKFLDQARVETIIRADGSPQVAWATTLDRQWATTSRWHSQLIYADLPASFYLIDGQRALYNRGEIDLGKRIALASSVKLNPQSTFTVFGGRLLDSTPSKGWIAQAGVSYELAPSVNRFLH